MHPNQHSHIFCDLSLRQKINLAVQRSLVFITLCLFYPLTHLWFFVLRGYRIRHLKSIRQQFKTLVQQKRPLIICANHLTYIDSLVLLIALGSFLDYYFAFSTLAWNFPKKKHLKGHWFYTIICYLCKCIPVASDPSVLSLEDPMKKANYLLHRGEYLMIFPEGSRSKTGKINDQEFTYGVGKLMVEVPQASVLCIYLRGRAQTCSSNFPKKGDIFDCTLKLLAPQSTHSGLRAARQISHLIIQTLCEMEQNYFSQGLC